MDRSRTDAKPGPHPPPDIFAHYREILPDADIRVMDVLFGLRATCQLLDNTIQSWLGPDALTPGRFQVMVVIWAAGKAIPQKQIVSALNVTRATVSELLEALVEDGLVTLVIDAADKRQSLASLTEAGLALTRQMVDTNTRRLRGVLQGLSSSDQDNLVRLLAELRDSVTTHRLAV